MLSHRNNRNNKMSVYNPFREMENFERRFFDNPFEVLMRNNDFIDFKADITDEGDCYKLQADLPGFKKDDIHLDVNGDMLTLSAERHSEHEDKDNEGKFIRCERSYGSYRRNFNLSNVNVEDIKAKYNNGVLTLTMPKKNKDIPSSRRLQIE